MPPKKLFFKVSGVFQYEKDHSEDDFCVFIKALDDRHAVMLVREHLYHNAPKGRSIINGIEKRIE